MGSERRGAGTANLESVAHRFSCSAIARVNDVALDGRWPCRTAAALWAPTLFPRAAPQVLVMGQPERFARSHLGVADIQDAPIDLPERGEGRIPPA